MKLVDVVGIIPVKANSERVKKKNLKKFGDTNLYELKLKQYWPVRVPRMVKKKFAPSIPLITGQRILH